jgi:hypothetical protein
MALCGCRLHLSTFQKSLGILIVWVPRSVGTALEQYPVESETVKCTFKGPISLGEVWQNECNVWNDGKPACKLQTRGREGRNEKN